MTKNATTGGAFDALIAVCLLRIIRVFPGRPLDGQNMRVLWMSSAFLLLHFLHSGFTAPVSDTDDQDSDDLAVDDDASSYAELSSTDFEGDMVGFLIIPVSTFNGHLL